MNTCKLYDFSQCPSPCLFHNNDYHSYDRNITKTNKQVKNTKPTKQTNNFDVKLKDEKDATANGLSVFKEKCSELAMWDIYWLPRLYYLL